MEDLKDPSQYMLYAWQGGLGLPDRVLFPRDSKSKFIENM
jgi:putative endopeptidase